MVEDVVRIPDLFDPQQSPVLFGTVVPLTKIPRPITTGGVGVLVNRLRPSGGGVSPNPPFEIIYQSEIKEITLVI